MNDTYPCICKPVLTLNSSTTTVTSHLLLFLWLHYCVLMEDSEWSLWQMMFPSWLQFDQFHLDQLHCCSVYINKQSKISRWELTSNSILTLFHKLLMNKTRSVLLSEPCVTWLDCSSQLTSLLLLTGLKAWDELNACSHHPISTGFSPV